MVRIIVLFELVAAGNEFGDVSCEFKASKECHDECLSVKECMMLSEITLGMS